MASKNKKSLIIFNRGVFQSYSMIFVTLLLIILFVSCQTITPMPDVFLEDSQFVPLDTGAAVYIFADVNEARQIIELLPIDELKDKQTKQLLDRTSYITAALFPPESGQRFQLAAWGNYPSSQADFAFTFDKNWKKQRSATGKNFWHSKANRLSISMTSRQAFVAASLNDTPFDPLTALPGAEIPEGYAAFRQGVPLSCWLENPGSMITRMLNDAGLPLDFTVQKLFINIFPLSYTSEHLLSNQNRYEAVIRFQFGSVSHARNLAFLLSLAGRFVQDDTDLIVSILLSNPPVHDGHNVDIKTSVLNETELISLFSVFSIF
ncbi:MAG: hypothetical protein FWD13_03345 [Treponema sp.]|nr:hypothetical protein [Treponema sp.]